MARPDRSDLDPITVEVVRHKLDGIANEMQSTLLRSSFSPIVKEGLDASASLFTPDWMAPTESACHRVIKRALDAIVPAHGMQLLVADSSDAHLKRVLT